MRCIYCNVDLEDAQKNCPLCGKPAADEKQHIARVTAPYPMYSGDKTDSDNSKVNK